MRELRLSEMEQLIRHPSRKGVMKLRRILAVSKFVHLTVSVAKLFSRTGELIQIYSDPRLFQAALDRAGQP